MLDRVTAADFEPLLGTEFTAAILGRDDLKLKLIEVNPLREQPSQVGQLPRRRPFSLLFRAATPDRLPQGAFAIASDRLGPLEVFMVPVGQDAEGLLLEAIFS